MVGFAVVGRNVGALLGLGVGASDVGFGLGAADVATTGGKVDPGEGTLSSSLRCASCWLLASVAATPNTTTRTSLTTCIILHEKLATKMIKKSTLL